MSVFGEIWNKIESFFEDKQAWEKAAQVALNVASPFVDEIATLVGGPAAGTAVQNVLAQIKGDLAAAITLIGDASGNSDKGKIVGLLTGVRSNLQTLLADVDVKNSAEIGKITQWVDVVDGELLAIVG